MSKKKNPTQKTPRRRLAAQDHEVREDRIVLVSLLMAELGVHSVAYAFPRVKIITAAVDHGLDDLLRVVPGIGEWRRRRADGEGGGVIK